MVSSPSLLVVALVALSAAREGVPTGDVVAIADIIRLPRPAAASRPAAVIHGQVIDDRAVGAARGLVVEDAGGGVLVVGLDTAVVAGTADGSLPAIGDDVEVRGHVEPGSPQAVVRATRIDVLGSRPLPDPRACDVGAFHDGHEECRLVAVEGIVHQAWRTDDGIGLEIESAGRLFVAELSAEATAAAAASAATGSPSPVDARANEEVGSTGDPMVPAEAGVAHGVSIQWPQGLVDAVVRVAGPASSQLNRRGEVVQSRIAVARGAWFTVVAPAPRTLEDPVPLDTITSPGGLVGRGHRVQTFGTVVHSVPGRVVFLQNGPAGVVVHLGAEAFGSDERFVPGDQVEVAGFVDRSGRVAAIRAAAVRRTGRHAPPEPWIVTPRAILDANGPGLGGGPESGDYDGCLVRFGGLLVQSQPTDDGVVLVLRSDGVIVAVEADHAAAHGLPELNNGSFVLVTGIATVERTVATDAIDGRPGRRMRLLLRDPADMVVTERPPWWTAARLAAGTAILGAILAAAMTWVVLLRHQVRVQRRRLAAEMRSRRDAALEFEATLRERTRLAANLHDTLQQTITGIGFQLDACGALDSDGAAMRGHLAVARRMVEHAAAELQGTVWTMRSLPLDGRRFGEALRGLAERLGDGHEVRMSVDAATSADELPDFVAGSILLIVQEAIHNALRHAGATRIAVTVTDDPARGLVRACVEDDGSGFAVGRQAGPEDGHFGIQGMRERAERLGGSLAIASRPGGGTVVEVLVGCRDYDAEMAER